MGQQKQSSRLQISKVNNAGSGATPHQHTFQKHKATTFPTHQNEQCFTYILILYVLFYYNVYYVVFQ